MKLGLLADIHEHVEYLKAALDQLGEAGVDRIVVLGDVFETGERIEETCELLRSADAIGVWGNHDFGLCVEPTDEIRKSYSPQVLEFFASLLPRLSLGGCHFSHLEPWLNPHKLEDLWYFDGPPHGTLRHDRIFSAIDEPIALAGHYHAWMAATPDGDLDWNGRQPLRLNDRRHFIVLGPLFAGDFAVLETDTAVITPGRVRSAPTT